MKCEFCHNDIADTPMVLHDQTACKTCYLSAFQKWEMENKGKLIKCKINWKGLLPLLTFGPGVLLLCAFFIWLFILNPVAVLLCLIFSIGFFYVWWSSACINTEPESPWHLETLPDGQQVWVREQQQSSFFFFWW